MNPKYNKIHNRFCLNGIDYTFTNLKEVAYSFVKEGSSYEKLLGNFLMDWLDEKDSIEVKTSGSTGKPKTIKVKKQAMVNSAIATGNFFKLKSGDSALHCLPSRYIAGKMMLIRAMILGLQLDLVEPTSKPKFNRNKGYDFCAMLPMQLQNSLEVVDHIKTIIIGGAPASKQLIRDIQNCKAKVFETYGMTETVSHIAVKKLNHIENVTLSAVERSHFKTFPDVKITQDERGCLLIDAPNFCDSKIITNDIVNLHSGTEFEWLGRFDHVINSGGIKIYPEQLERKLEDKLNQRFFIASVDDNLLGEKVILVLEGENNVVEPSIFEGFEKHEIPKQVYAISEFIETTSRKVQRQQTLESIKSTS